MVDCARRTDTDWTGNYWEFFESLEGGYCVLACKTGRLCLLLAEALYRTNWLIDSNGKADADRRDDRNVVIG